MLRNGASLTEVGQVLREHDVTARAGLLPPGGDHLVEDLLGPSRAEQPGLAEPHKEVAQTEGDFKKARSDYGRAEAQLKALCPLASQVLTVPSGRAQPHPPGVTVTDINTMRTIGKIKILQLCINGGRRIKGKNNTPVTNSAPGRHAIELTITCLHKTASRIATIGIVKILQLCISGRRRIKRKNNTVIVASARRRHTI